MSNSERAAAYSDPKIVAIAKKFIGVKEIGKNASFDNEEFGELLSLYGWVPGYPWCMFFAKAVWHLRYTDTDHAPVVMDVLNGSTISSFRRAKQNPLIHVTDMPVIGGIVIWETAPIRGHAGIVSKVKNEFDILTIEGNTNKRGSRDGDTVLERSRPLNVRANRWRYLGCINPLERNDHVEDTQEGVVTSADGLGRYGLRSDSTSGVSRPSI